MTFHEFDHTMVVMNGYRRVAVARFRNAGGWLCRIDNGSWLNARARTGGLIPGKFPNLLHVKGKPEARQLLQGLAEFKPYKPGGLK